MGNKFCFLCHWVPAPIQICGKSGTDLNSAKIRHQNCSSYTGFSLTENSHVSLCADLPLPLYH